MRVEKEPFNLVVACPSMNQQAWRSCPLLSYPHGRHYWAQALASMNRARRTPGYGFQKKRHTEETAHGEESPLRAAGTIAGSMTRGLGLYGPATA